MTATSDHKFQINIYRLDIFNNIFEQLILDSTLFGSILNKIKVILIFSKFFTLYNIIFYLIFYVKVEYDEYLFYLLRNQQLIKLNHKNLNDQLEKAQSLYSSLMLQISEKTEEIKKVQGLVAQTARDNLSLENKIAEEKEFAREKEVEFYEKSENIYTKYFQKIEKFESLFYLFINLGQLSIKTKSSQTSSKFREDLRDSYEIETDSENDLTIEFKSPKSKKKIITENLESTKHMIMQKIENLEKINANLKKDYVPMVILNNLNQSCKDVDVRILFIFSSIFNH